jgi:mannose-1-phosphate guanylyltransferase
VNVQSSNLWVIILAGADGRRLSALTVGRDGLIRPKQFGSLNGGPSLVQLALKRAEGLAPGERIVTVVTEANRRWWEAVLPPSDPSTVVVQPSNRGTGLDVLLPLLVIAKKDPKASVICLPSDRYVEREDVLAQAMQQATAPSAFGLLKLSLLGMPPNAPDPGYGYLSALAESGVGMRPVRYFIEKPDAQLAALLIRAGSLWNSGIFAGRLQLLLQLFPRHVPGLLTQMQAVVNRWSGPRVPSRELVALYACKPTVDFSHAVLQMQQTLLQFLTVPPCGWIDVGTPERLAATLSRLRLRVNGDASATAPPDYRANAWALPIPATNLAFGSGALH